MIRKYKKNRLENRENLVFYTDGSLVRTVTEKGERVRMGASWVQVGLDKKEILDTGYVGTQEWPSSTKSELIAIWLALLTVLERTKVQINTDSKVAISNIDASNEDHTSR